MPRVHLVGVRNIGFEKLVAIAVFLCDAVEIREVAGIREHVHVRDRRLVVMFQNIANKVAPDEATAARNQDAHCSAY